MADAPEIIAASLRQLLERHESLAREQASSLLGAILDLMQQPLEPAVLSDTQFRIAALLGALTARGETTDELAGFVDTLRERVIRIPLDEHERASLVDTCGTGGEGTASNTFNISTAAALVAAAAGVRIAKHGNRAVTSRCGSADVLEALGIAVDLTPEQAAHSLRTHNFAFLPAPALQPALRHLMPIRRAIGVRTAFNILGPMTNPAGAPAQVLGVYSDHLVPIVAQTLARLSTRHAYVVRGFDSASEIGLDEFSISGPTSVAEVKFGAVSYSTVTPADFGLAVAPIGTLAGGDAQANAAILRAIFAGEPGPRRDVVVMNAAAVLVTANLSPDFRAGAALAQETIDAGRVTRLLERLAAS